MSTDLKYDPETVRETLKEDLKLRTVKVSPAVPALPCPKPEPKRSRAKLP